MPGRWLGLQVAGIKHLHWLARERFNDMDQQLHSGVAVKGICIL